MIRVNCDSERQQLYLVLSCNVRTAGSGWFCRVP